jgi:Xaa-Pro aminopeptidase
MDLAPYLDYMSRNGLDAVIASDYRITARIRGRYFKDAMLMAAGLREFNPLAGFTAKGECVVADDWLFDDAIDRMATVLKEKGLASGRIGLETENLPVQSMKRLQDRLPNACFVDASPVFLQGLSRKTEREIGFIRKSVEASEAGFREVAAHLRECLGRPVSDLIWRHYAPTVNRYGAELVGSNLSGEAWSASRTPASRRSLIAASLSFKLSSTASGRE